MIQQEFTQKAFMEYKVCKRAVSAKVETGTPQEFVVATYLSPHVNI
jgi:hypothetical protein